MIMQTDGNENFETKEKASILWANPEDSTNWTNKTKRKDIIIALLYYSTYANVRQTIECVAYLSITLSLTPATDQSPCPENRSITRTRSTYMYLWFIVLSPLVVGHVDLIR